MKYIESRKHSLEAFQKNFKQVITAKEVEDLLTWYLATVKAHPAFINCSFLLSARKLPDDKLQAFQKIAHKTFQKLGFNKYSDFTRWRATQYDIFHPDGTPIPNVHEGVIEASMLSNYGLLYENLHKRILDKEDIRYFTDLMKSFVCHPKLNLRSLDTAIVVIGAAQNSLQSVGEEVDLFKVMQKWIYAAANRILLSTDPRQLAEDFADIWLDGGGIAARWVLYDLFLNQPLQKLATPEKPIITPVLEELYNIADKGRKRLSENAKRWLQFFPADPSKFDEELEGGFAVMGLMRTVEALKNELPNPITYQLFIRLLQDVNPTIRWQIILQLGTTVVEGVPRIDDRAQQLFESVLGMDTWKLLCEVQDDRYWTDIEVDTENNLVSRLGMRFDLPEVQRYADGVKQVEWQRHASKTCLALEKLVDSTGVTPLEIESLKAERLYLLSEEVIRTVTHSYTHPTVLRRRKNEFLGAELPKVTLSEINARAYGAACKFLLFVPDQTEPLVGEMSEDGAITFENVLAITPLTRAAAEAVVIDSLSQILIPQLIESLPATGKSGFRIPATTEVYAVRPTIHTLGDLENRDNDLGAEPGGTKINPEIATKLFEWLLGLQTNCQFRLYKAVTVKQLGRKETYFCTDYHAHELIMNREISLSDVYMRTVRAHTRPLGVYYNTRGEIVTQSMSTRAERNYERYLLDIGRKLDFSQVRKTYTLPNHQKIVLDIPRTFNQGAFCSLEEAWIYVQNLEVKAKASQSFKF